MFYSDVKHNEALTQLVLVIFAKIRGKFKRRVAISHEYENPQNMAQFHKACKHKNLLSIKFLP